MIFYFYFYPSNILLFRLKQILFLLTHSLTMSSVVKFSPFASALKAAVSKINSIVSDMDEKVDTFAEKVIEVLSEHVSQKLGTELFPSGEENVDVDRAELKQNIINLFEMFQPEKRATSVSGYNIFCKEQREAVKERNPQLSASEILGALGAEWKALDKDEKEEWNSRAKLAKPMTSEEKSAKRSASRKPAEKKEKVKCQYDGCDKCPKEPKEHTDGKVYCSKHLDKVILAEAKTPKSSPKTEAKPEPKVNKNKSASKKTEEKKEEKKELSNKEKLEKKLEEANKKLAEKTSAVSAPKPITVSPKTSAKAVAPVKKTTFDFTSEPKPISENIDFWACKKVNLDKNTAGKRWRYNSATGLCFEDNDDFVLAATWIDGAVAWLDEIPEEVKEWARKCGCEVPVDEDIELDGEFSDDE
jgi:hypothetical protein